MPVLEARHDSIFCVSVNESYCSSRKLYGTYVKNQMSPAPVPAELAAYIQSKPMLSVH